MGRYYKPVTPLNKVNLCWVLDDGRAGHRLQSETLARALAHRHICFEFKLKQPWLSLTPWRLPGFAHAVQWLDAAPDETAPPDCLIACGRRAAALGKHLSARAHAPHIQILNPGDRLQKYDLIVAPQHDRLSGEHVINIEGSVHPVDAEWLTKQRARWSSTFNSGPGPLLAVLLGDLHCPAAELLHKLKSILDLHPSAQVMVCASRRTPDSHKRALRSYTTERVRCWLDARDGDNPYAGLLSSADAFVVSSDSINMLCESLATGRPVALLNRSRLSAKHRRFLNDQSNQFTAVAELFNTKVLAPKSSVCEEILRHPAMQKLMNRPSMH